MGFDLHGVAPKINEPEPAILKQHHWGSVPEDVREDYFSASDAYEEANPGIYFRNNVWWWRPLWTYVCSLCDDILTENDMEKGGHNGGQTISKTKAQKIATRILMANKSGDLDVYAQQYKETIANLPKEKCTICDGVGMRTPPLLNKDFEPNTDQDTLEKCNGCEGTGKRRAWAASYPFSVENAVEFANFAKESGGFQIC
jgi:hypothetical protein